MFQLLSIIIQRNNGIFDMPQWGDVTVLEVLFSVSGQLLYHLRDHIYLGWIVIMTLSSTQSNCFFACRHLLTWIVFWNLSTKEANVLMQSSNRKVFSSSQKYSANWRRRSSISFRSFSRCFISSPASCGTKQKRRQSLTQTQLLQSFQSLWLGFLFIFRGRLQDFIFIITKILNKCNVTHIICESESHKFNK